MAVNEHLTVHRPFLNVINYIDYQLGFYNSRGSYNIAHYTVVQAYIIYKTIWLITL